MLNKYKLIFLFQSSFNYTTILHNTSMLYDICQLQSKAGILKYSSKHERACTTWLVVIEVGFSRVVDGAKLLTAVLAFQAFFEFPQFSCTFPSHARLAF